MELKENSVRKLPGNKSEQRNVINLGLDWITILIELMFVEKGKNHRVLLMMLTLEFVEKVENWIVAAFVDFCTLKSV